MSDARSEILGAVRGAIAKNAGKSPDPTTEPQDASHTEARGRLANHPANLIPARGRLGEKARVDLFIREAERIDATVARVSSTAGVPREVARFLAKNNLPMTLKISPETSEETIPWTEQTLLSVEEGRANGTEKASVSRAFAGVAETGTLVMLSGPGNPTTLNFLPPTHICVVAAAEIVGDYEEVWARLRTEKNVADEEGNDGTFMPRTVNWITGPSRTADIEQTLLLGAHGPQRLHIVIIDD
ncbi:MAG: lactate utilization protein [Rhodospirillales bacterium]|nr:lactate utilization protein [Rhodospirillales bacterium]